MQCLRASRSLVSCGVVVQEIVRLTGAVLVWCCCRVVCGVVDSLVCGWLSCG